MGRRGGGVVGRPKRGGSWEVKKGGEVGVVVQRGAVGGQKRGGCGADGRDSIEGIDGGTVSMWGHMCFGVWMEEGGAGPHLPAEDVVEIEGEEGAGELTRRVVH